MAVIGFSHIVSEVSDLDASVEFYSKKGFQMKYMLEMDVPPIKKEVLKGDAKRIRLAYLVFKDDEACNLELIQHDTEKSYECAAGEKIGLNFFTSRVANGMSIEDLDGNRIGIFPQPVSKKNKTKHYVLPVQDLTATSKFYIQNFNMCIVEGEQACGQNIIGYNNNVLTLSFEKCLHANWDGCLHLVENKDFKSDKKYLNELGFHSFCFLVSNVERDIYAKFSRQSIIGPFQEQKQVDGKDVKFEVGFVYDPNGYPLEYFLLS